MSAIYTVQVVHILAYTFRIRADSEEDAEAEGERLAASLPPHEDQGYAGDAEAVLTGRWADEASADND